MSPDDIRDIRSPWLIGAWWRWPLAIGAGVLLVVGVILVVRYVRKRRSRPLTPHEQALAALGTAAIFAQEGRSREWANIVADTLRLTISAQLGRELAPLTTRELARAWSATTLDIAPRILVLLETCDLARFARASLDDQALLAQTAIARELVERLFSPSPPPSPTPPQPATVAP